MKVLQITPAYSPAYRYGGPIESVHNLNKELVRQGVNVTVYTTSADGEEDLNVPLGVPVDRDGVRVYYFRIGLFRRWFYSCALHRMLAKTAKDFDVIHITSTFLFASFLGSWYAKKYGVPCVISPRGNLMKEPLSLSSLKKKIYLACIEKYNLARASAIHFTSEEERNDYIELGFPIRRAIVIPNGITLPALDAVRAEEILDFKKKLRIPPGAMVISYLGRISEIKGFDVLIPAFAEVLKTNPNALLLIIGGDDEKGYKKKVQALVAGFKIEDKVIFVGMRSGHEKEIALASSCALMQPSASESFGMAGAEAAAMGVPVVLTRGVGLAKLIEKNNAGIVVHKNVEDLARAIRTLVGNKKLRDVMGENGRRVAEENFSGENVAKRFISEYNDILNRHKNRAII